ncbi:MULTISPECIES: acetyl-CoA hydrolase/transferase C-terminal domain-containing protein [unclassified Micromonospora]|uniref:acetyl-CoA hydrolase/transferase C-terminal domain-containing protein n=1 Tax=unclassified Micromonospora TaxID=2617518 RepID=UPI0033A75BF9
MVPAELTPDEARVAARIAEFLTPGCRVAIADGAGAPVGLGRPLAYAARQVGGVRLLLGWSFTLPVPEDPVAFPEVRTLLGGYALRRAFGGGVRYLPVRLSAVPALFASAWRPDVLLAGLRPTPGGLGFGSEVAWMRAAVDAGAHVLAEVNHALPAASREPALPAGRVTIVSEVERPPLELLRPRVDDVSDAAGRHVAALVRPGSAVQFGPGTIGDATLRALDVPVRIDSGIVGDAVLDLDRRGLLEGVPLATYVAGTAAAYRWADGRAITARLEHTHDLTRLSRQPLVAVNTALELDLVGQVNVEGFGGDVVAGVGGHPDYAVAAARAIRGLSVVALPTRRGGHRTLVDRLSAPTSTARSDVDVVVTEHGSVDLRGRTDAERTAALRRLWEC